MKKLLSLTFVLSIIYSTQAQQYVDLMNNPNASLSETYDAFLDHLDGRNVQDVPGAKQFMRWYTEASRMAYPHDNLNHASAVWNSYVLNNFGTGNSLNKIGGTWQSYGPAYAPSGGHNGRVDDIAIDPSDPNTWYICGAMGLWKTTDDGANWTPLTDDYPMSGVYNVETCPTDPNRVYFTGTGYYDYATSSLGVFKSTDGGNTFSLTSFNYATYGGFYVRDMIVDPTDEDRVIVSAQDGLFETTDGGTTWNQIYTYGAREIAFKPGDPNTIYAVGQDFRYTNDGGATWFSPTTGYTPSSGMNLSLAVTPANPDVVYICRHYWDGGFDGCWKSTDSGVNFTQMSDGTYNIFGYSVNGSATGGQGSYCMSMAADPTDENTIVAGGIYLYISNDGGATWNSSWTIAGTHADVQSFHYANGSLYFGNDGGVFRTDDYGQNWEYFQNMQTSLVYNVTVSELAAGSCLTGWQDNGSNDYSDGTWDKVLGGDGFGSVIDFTDDDWRISSYQYGVFAVTTDGMNYSSMVGSGGSGVNSQGYFITEIKQNRTNPYELMIAKDNLYLTQDKGVSWQASGTIPYTSLWTKISSFDYCLVNPDYIYIESVGEVFRSEDHGQTWTDITAGIEVDSAYIQDIMVSPTDSLHVWVSMAGSCPTEKIYESTDGGDNWTNISAGLPNLPTNHLLYQKGTDDRIYVSMRDGIYTRDNANPTWELYGTGLPHVNINELAIDYETSTLYAATYGRGIWTNEILYDSVAPIANSVYFTQSQCGLPNGEVAFIDISNGTPTSWEWTFIGGTPATSTMPSPYVYYDTDGTYDVELIVTNQWGTDTMNYSINVQNIPVPPVISPNVIEDFEGVSTLPSYMTIDNPDAGVTWEVVDSIGAYSASDYSLKIDNYDNGNSGNQDDFLIDAYDVADANSIILTFDVANKPYDATKVDTLRIQVSNDCGQTWTQVFNEHGQNMWVNTQYSTDYLVPELVDWRSYSVSLNSFIGSERLAIKFENHSGEGNVLYLDNINLNVSNDQLPVANYTASTYSICEGDSVYFEDNSQHYPNAWEWDFVGGSPSNSSSNSEWVTYNTPGVYDVELISFNSNGSDTIYSAALIEVFAKPTTPVITANGGELSTDPGYTYEWYWDGYLLSGLDTNVINVTQSGDYTVVITDANGCTSEESLPINVQISGFEENNPQYISVFPNPTQGLINIEMGEAVPVGIEVFNTIGQVVYTYNSNGSAQFVLDLSALPQGVYLLRIGSDGSYVNKRVTINR